MPNLSSMGFLPMKTLVLASLLATSASAAVSAGNTNSAVANTSSAVATAAAPYTFLLKFPDGSLEICPATGFLIGFPEINVDVVSCTADKVFGDAFGG
jgi:hypothetical protein